MHPISSRAGRAWLFYAGLGALTLVIIESPLRRAGAGASDAPFSARELEVLALLDGPALAREMAEDLFVSTNTVRWYLGRVYRKLGVGDRASAVERARELGLLRGGWDESGRHDPCAPNEWPTTNGSMQLRADEANAAREPLVDGP